MMGKLVHFSMPLQMRRGLTMTERIMFPWEGRDMLKLKIELGRSFHFQITRSMQRRRTICMLSFYIEV